jgi:hypothetical protein
MQCLRLLHSASADLAQYESPKLATIAVSAPPQRERVVRMEVAIFNTAGKLEQRIIDGEVVEDHTHDD